MKIYNWWLNTNSWLEKKSSLLSAWASVIAILGIPLIFLSALATWTQLTNYFQRPDIDIQWYSPKKVSFAIINVSEKLAKEPEYMISLWDLDTQAKGSVDDAGNLMIPTKKIDSIRPKSGRGPWSIESLSKARMEIPDGNVIFGWASVQCPECISRKDYWLLLKKGETAWYSEINENEKTSIWYNLKRVIDSGSNYPSVIAKLVPQNKRMLMPEYK